MRKFNLWQNGRNRNKKQGGFWDDEDQQLVEQQLEEVGETLEDWEQPIIKEIHEKEILHQKLAPYKSHIFRRNEVHSVYIGSVSDRMVWKRYIRMSTWYDKARQRILARRINNQGEENNQAAAREVSGNRPSSKSLHARPPPSPFCGGGQLIVLFVTLILAPIFICHTFSCPIHSFVTLFLASASLLLLPPCRFALVTHFTS